MNAKHPYEKHLAEKLVQLPPPDDPDQNWQQMKKLLDKNMPRGGGNGPGGSYRWWIAGSIVIAVVVGTWFGGKQFMASNRQNESLAGTINKTTSQKATPAHTATTTGSDKKAGQLPADPKALDNVDNKVVETPQPTPATNNAAVTTGAGSNPAAGTRPNEPIVTSPVPAPGDAAVNDNNTTGKNPDYRVQVVQKDDRSSNNNETNNELAAADNNKSVLPAGPKTNDNHEITANRTKIYSSKKKNNSNNKPRNYTSGHNTSDLAIDRGQNAGRKNTRPTRPAKNKNEVQPDAGNTVYTPSVTVPSQPASRGIEASPVSLIVNYTGSTVAAPSGMVQREFTYYTQADLFPELAAQKKSSGSRRSSRSSESREDKMFAVGLSLPLTFPLGDQQALSFNRQAGANQVSDYLPSPHFQYHFNGKTYLQTELQLSAPQYIRPILLYEHKTETQPNTFVKNSVYARKLYYFNLPVSVYHSPLRNFYMGTGIQFSSMLSGVALYEKTKQTWTPGGPNQYILSQYYTKFKNDSLSRRFNGNELRLLLNMNYYWNRFTVGLQYTQAFNNYVNFQVNSMSPYILDKNKSLQFYLRYNIWEDKKRKRKNESLLTLK